MIWALQMAFDQTTDGIAVRRQSRYNIRMNKPLKLIPIGNSTGVILPKEVLARLRVERGGQLNLIETPDGYRIQVSDPEFEKEMEIAREIMRKDRAILRELAK